MTPASPMQTGVHAPLHFDRGKVEQAVEDGAEALETMADDLYVATDEFERAEAEWDKTSLIEEATIAETREKTSERIRQGIVLRKYQNEAVYLDYVVKRAHAHAIDKKYRALASAVSARQSLLKRQS